VDVQSQGKKLTTPKAHTYLTKWPIWQDSIKDHINQCEQSKTSQWSMWFVKINVV
jgi:hypothetical protein